MGDLYTLDYEKLKKCISDRMPAEYLAGPVVEERYYDNPFFNFELNFNPYRRGGQILPTEIRYYDKEDIIDGKGRPISRGYYNFPKGYDWLPIYFWATERHNEKHLLPVAFITIFTRHFIKSYVENYRSISNTFNTHELMRLSGDELRANGYESPDHRCKEFLETQTKDAHQAGITDLVWGLSKNNSPLTEEVLSDVIIKCIKFMTDRYHIEHWSYPDKEYDRAEQIYKDAAYRMQDELLRMAEVRYRHLTE